MIHLAPHIKTLPDKLKSDPSVKKLCFPPAGTKHPGMFMLEDQCITHPLLLFGIIAAIRAAGTHVFRRNARSLICNLLILLRAGARLRILSNRLTKVKQQRRAGSGDPFPRLGDSRAGGG